jgi:hypothetical protein
MAEFFNIEGEIPVSLMLRLSEVPAEFKPSAPSLASASVAWDTDPPRGFDPSSARRNGTAMSEAAFWPFVAKVRARSKAAPRLPAAGGSIRRSAPVFPSCGRVYAPETPRLACRHGNRAAVRTCGISA